jgi:16S rRNA processing protein RimM
MATDTPERVTLGRIVGIHGLQGWLKVISYTDPREGIFDYRPLIVGDQEEREFIGKVHGKGLLIQFPGREDRTAVESLVNAEIAVSRDQLPELPDGEFFWSDLEGLTVVDLEGRELGRVEVIMPTGANDVIVVQGRKKMMIPFVQGQYVMDVDLEQGRMVVDWSEDWL